MQFVPATPDPVLNWFRQGKTQAHALKENIRTHLSRLKALLCYPQTRA